MMPGVGVISRAPKLSTCQLKVVLVRTLRGNGSVLFGIDGFLDIGVNNGTSTFDGVMSGTGFVGGYTVGKFGSGTFTLNGNNTYLNQTRIFSGRMVINGNQPQSPVVVDVGTILQGSGTVGHVSIAGTVAPGASPAILTSSNVAFSAGANFTVELNGTLPGTGYDRLNVRGTNNLGGANLNVNAAFPIFDAPSPGDRFVILNNDGVDPITGTFVGKANGSVFTADNLQFRINYNGGDGNDVVLTLTNVGTVALAGGSVVKCSRYTVLNFSKSLKSVMKAVTEVTSLKSMPAAVRTSRIFASDCRVSASIPPDTN